MSVLSSLSPVPGSRYPTPASAPMSVCQDEASSKPLQHAHNNWDAYYAKPRTNTRTTKQVQTIVGLEAENASLKMTVEERLREIEALKTALAEREARGGEPQPQKTVSVLEPRAAPERMPFHPEFLDFMRETFACEVMRTCNAQRMAAETAAVDARVQFAALEGKVAALEEKLVRDNAIDVDMDAAGDDDELDADGVIDTIAQAEAARALD
ncbi:hypothetical protein DFH06DRAFT_1232588 [Mycena polygramma]|nr:hypothetical protein DFH06DRAFT_1232588 [Mycena polygramma]